MTHIPSRLPVVRRVMISAALALIAGATACSWGATPSRMRRLAQPAGVTVTVHMPEFAVPLHGELYAVDSTSLYVVFGQLTRVRFDRLSQLVVDDLRTAYSASGTQLFDPSWRERMRLLSRFPQGLTGTLRQRVLAELKQADIVDVGLPDRSPTSSQPPP